MFCFQSLNYFKLKNNSQVIKRYLEIILQKNYEKVLKNLSCAKSPFFLLFLQPGLPPPPPGRAQLAPLFSWAVCFPQPDLSDPQLMLPWPSSASPAKLAGTHPLSLLFPPRGPWPVGQGHHPPSVGPRGSSPPAPFSFSLSPPGDPCPLSH